MRGAVCDDLLVCIFPEGYTTQTIKIARSLKDYEVAAILCGDRVVLLDLRGVLKEREIWCGKDQIFETIQKERK